MTEPLPFHDATALRSFLQRQTVDHISCELMPGLLAGLRRLSAPGDEDGDEDEADAVPLEDVGAFLDAILLAHADRLMADADREEGANAMQLESGGLMPPVTRDAFFERFKPKSSTQVLCGYLFQRNDIVFNCKTCQSDETCVLCLKCFQNGNHEGHDVFFHRTSPGGVCDCGDSEAWAPEGFCMYHGKRDGDAAAAPGSGGASSLPVDMVRVADALFEVIVAFCVEMAKKSMQVFDAEKVDAQGRQWLQELRQKLQERGDNRVDVPMMVRQFHVRICNDDVHSDEDLIRSLTHKRIPRAEDLVRAIDSNGSEIVAKNLTLRDALTLMQALKTEGWHVCVVQDQHVHDEDVLLRVTQWVKTICSLSKPLHVLFCDKLFATSSDQSKEPIQIMFLSDPYFRKDIVLELYELYLKLQGDKDPKLQFSVVFLKVYSRMMLKYFCGVGTREESLFQYGVQILTTPSIVHHLAGLGLLDMLLDTINTALEMARAPTLPPHQHQGVYHTLDCDHPLLKFKRYHYVIENFGYVLGIPAMSSDLLMRPELLRKWMDALAEIQGLDPQVRIQDSRAHVTYETQSWLTAFAFHANVSKIITFTSKGLRYHEAVDKATLNMDRERMVFNVLEGFWDQLERTDMTARLQVYVPPCGRLMGAPFSEKIVKFDVTTQPVSFHNPLHGLLASFLIESLYYGPPPDPGSAVPWITDWGAIFEQSMSKVLRLNGGEDETLNDFIQHKKMMLIYGMMEYPLRSMVLCAQVSCGLWIRNGQNMQRQMLNYTSPPWCSELRDLDLFLVQVSAMIVGFPKFLTIFFDRFGISEWLLSWINCREASNESSGISAREAQCASTNDEKLVGVLEAALLQFIWIVTELTPPLDAIELRDTVLRREIIHRLSQQPCRLSELLDQTTFVVSTPYGGISARQEKQHLTRLERVLDEVADEQVKRSVMVAPLGDGGADDNIGDGAMEPTKYVLKKEYFKEYDPAFYHLSRPGHEKAQFARQEALFKTWKVEDQPIPLVSQLPPPHVSLGTVRFLVIEQGLLGVLRLVLEDANCPTDGKCDGMSCVPGAKRTNVMVVLRTIHLINLAVLVLKRGAGSSTLPQQNEVVLPESKRRKTLTLLRSGPEMFGEVETTTRGKKRVKRLPISNEGDGDVQMSSDSDQGDFGEVNELSIAALLVALSKDQVKHDFETSKPTISAIYWIMRELAALDPVIHAYVELKVWSGMKKHEELMAENGMSKAQLKKHHQQRAIEAMVARQLAFTQSSTFAEMEEEEEDIDDGGESSSGGKLDMDANDSSNDIPGHTIVYRPPPPPDCIICSQKERDEPIMYIGHAQMSKVNENAFENLPADVETSVSDSSNDNSSPSTSTTGTTSFPPHIYLSLCGHAVHLHCWQKYFESVRAQSQFNLEHSQTNIAFDAHFGEFLCPLCQALSSMLVPCLPICPPLTLADQQRDRDAMERVFQSKQDTSSILSWLSEGLPSRLEELGSQDDSMCVSDGEEDEDEDEDEIVRRQRQDDIRAMNQFAVSFLEAMLRFQPEMTHLTAAMTALKKGFFSTGPQLTHLIWSSVASTITSAQLSGISSAIYSLEMFGSASKSGHQRSSWRPNASNRSNGSTGSSSTASSFSSLQITSILNPTVPCLKTRVAVSLPEALDPQLDQFTPKDDSKLNVLLRSLRRVPLLFKNRRRGFYRSMCRPIARNLRLALSPEEWLHTLPHGSPLQLGQPILGQDLFYLCVAVCSSMLTTKAEILLTLRSLCVLHMAQVLIQLAQMETEDEDDCFEEEQVEIEQNRDVVNDRLTPAQVEEMQRGLEVLMTRLAQEAGVGLVSDESRRPPQGRQLQLLFKSSCLAFMRQVTLLCRAFFRGEQDPDAAWSANFVSSLRLSTNYHDMCQQLGLPTVTQLMADEALVEYLEQAARELRVRPTCAAVPEELQSQYKQNGLAELLIGALQGLIAGEEKENEDQEQTVATATEQQALIARGNLREIPALPLRLEPDPQQNKLLFHFANLRLVRLASSYTDLHSEVLGKSKCKQTWKTVENPAICLVCEQVLCAGTECCRRRSDGMGACTHHAITCGAGVGLFFLMRSSSVLLVFGPRSSYFGSPYLDMFGEEDINVRRGRPLYLNAKRMKALQALYANHQLANEVARNRRTSDQYIRNNYY